MVDQGTQLLLKLKRYPRLLGDNFDDDQLQSDGNENNDVDVDDGDFGSAGVRFMTTRTLTDATDPAQHWTDNFDLPIDEVIELVDRIFERYFSGI